jgi:hypothetical protein
MCALFGICSGGDVLSEISFARKQIVSHRKLSDLHRPRTMLLSDGP